MDFKELKELIAIFEGTELSEIEIEEDGRRMRLQKTPTSSGTVSYMAPAPVAQTSFAMPVTTGQPAPTPPEEVKYANTIDSPMVGTFYAAPAPGEPPFVKEGDQVSDGSTVCIVEAMKLMNEVGAKSNCVIEKILVENGEPVEYGQPLFAIRKLA